MEVSASNVLAVGYGPGSPAQGNHGPRLQITLQSQALSPTTTAVGNRPSGMGGSGRLTHHLGSWCLPARPPLAVSPGAVGPAACRGDVRSAPESAMYEGAEVPKPLLPVFLPETSIY